MISASVTTRPSNPIASRSRPMIGRETVAGTPAGSSDG
jgi:hypothetical protein